MAGNQSLEKVTDNALRVLAAAGLDQIPVVAGQDKPLMRPSLHCPQIHGESGLDGPFGGPVLPPATHSALPQKAVLVMAETIRERFLLGDGNVRIQLVATGALTNVALLLILYPEFIDMVNIVLMGGALGVGNTGPVVEFNIQTDPEAARVVFESGAHVTMIPLEVTHTALATPEILSRINTPPNHPFLELIVELLTFFAETYKRVFKFEHPPLHDPCAVAYVIAPELFKTERVRVDIETCSTLSAGQTVVDVWGSSGKAPNAVVCMEMDVMKFWDLMVDAIHAAAVASPLREKTKVIKVEENGILLGIAPSSTSSFRANSSLEGSLEEEEGLRNSSYLKMVENDGESSD